MEKNLKCRKGIVGKILLGTGVLSWPRKERIFNRYGTVMLMQEGMNSFSTEEGPVELTNKPNPNQYGRMIAKVVQSRQSTHIGDLSREIFPTTPYVGEEIFLGEGYLFYDKFLAYQLVGLYPDDNRITDWLNPENLYRAHEQSVELYFESHKHLKEGKIIGRAEKGNIPDVPFNFGNNAEDMIHHYGTAYQLKAKRRH